MSDTHDFDLSTGPDPVGPRIVPAWEGSLPDLVARKEATTISVCLPARNEQSTVSHIVAAIHGSLVATGLVDELIVFDDGSTDDTARVADEAGAQVVPVSSVLPELGEGAGKGNVLWRSVAASTGDIIVWCDTDLTSFTTDYVTRLVAPLLDDDRLGFVKGFYDRPLDGEGRGGGRTTELMARPLLSLFFPPLARFRQPLGGESAARRDVLERVPFVESYGVESALLIDIAELAGIEAMVQVDLGQRVHRHRDLLALSHQAAEILGVVLARAGVELADPLPPLLAGDGSVRPVVSPERPPLLSVAGYRESRSLVLR